MFIPSSRAHRRRRLAKVRALRKAERKSKEKLLKDIENAERIKQQQREKILLPFAQQLALLLGDVNVLKAGSPGKAIEMGIRAWQIGGIEYMKQLHTMTMSQIKSKCNEKESIDYLSIWWDGVGSWQSDWLEGRVKVGLGTGT
jgi:hypothetical protein